MSINRRSFLGGLGVAIPAAVAGSCAMANASDWPGPETAPGQLPKMPVGMNLSTVVDYNEGFPFRNLMFGARPWMSRNSFGGGPWDTNQARFFDFDDDGYPLEVPLKTPGGAGVPQQLFTLLPNVLTAGRYVVLFDGEGSLEGFLGSRVVSEQPGRLVLDMGHQEKVVEGLAIRKSRRGNHVRNIRVFAANENPATLSDQPFRQDFLDFCRPFHALRFKDWQATDNSIEGEWSNRRLPTFFTMAATTGDVDGYWGPPLSPYEKSFAGGVAHELIIQLSNMLRIDPWISIPHRATDDYIRRCAALYRAKLAPERKIYLEYSNEVWNWGYNQSHWMLRSEQAGEILERRGVKAWEMKDGKRQGTNYPERMGALFSRTSRLWLDEWQGQDRARVTTICGIQGNWADPSLRTIDWCHADGLTNAVTSAGYFGPDKDAYTLWESRGAALTADDVIASMRRIVEQQAGKGATYQIATHARDRGMAFLNYEAGQHIQPEGQQDKPYMPALKAAQTHPAMYDLYVETMRQQRHLGSKLFCHYSSIGKQGLRWGSWGAKESYSQPNSTSPKMRALLDCNA